MADESELTPITIFFKNGTSVTYQVSDKTLNEMANNLSARPDRPYRYDAQTPDGESRSLFLSFTDVLYIG